MLSTIHQPHMGFTGENNPKTKRQILKPISIIDYNSKRGTICNIDDQDYWNVCFNPFNRILPTCDLRGGCTLFRFATNFLTNNSGFELNRH